MDLRNLELRDAPLMLEWMHDASIVHDLNRDFSILTIADCEHFICNSLTKNDIHLAIVDEQNVYMGTVSLKKIDYILKIAELGITVRKSAMGKGYAIFAMKKMLDIARKRGIKKIFWCVSPKNTRALRFYDKNGFERIKFSQLGIDVDYSKEKISEFIWYLVIT